MPQGLKLRDVVADQKEAFSPPQIDPPPIGLPPRRPRKRQPRMRRKSGGELHLVFAPMVSLVDGVNQRHRHAYRWKRVCSTLPGRLSSEALASPAHPKGVLA